MKRITGTESETAANYDRLRELFPSGSTVLTAYRGDTKAGTKFYAVYAEDGAPVSAFAVAMLTGLPYDAKRDAVAVRPADILPDYDARATLGVVFGKSLARIGESYTMYRAPVKWVLYGPTGPRAYATDRVFA